MAKMAPYLAFIAGLIFALVAVPDAVEGLWVAHRVDNFVPTEATVLSHTAKKHQKGPETQLVKFRYKVGKSTYEKDNYWTRTSDTDADIKQRIKKDDDGIKTMTVYYDQEHPKIVVIRKEVSPWVNLGIIGVTGFLLFGSVMSFLTDKKRQAKIARNAPR